LTGHLSWKCSSPATRTSSWPPTTSWITCMSLTTMTGSEGHHYERRNSSLNLSMRRL
jgi:hypothetical protein